MNRLIFRSLITASVLFVLFCVPSIASADGIAWDLNLKFADGGTGSGSFVYDVATNTYNPISITTTTVGTFPGTTYTSLSFVATGSSTGLTLGVSSGDLTNTSLLFLLFDAPLTNSGGIIQLSLLSPNDSAEDFCTNSDCSAFSERLVTGGQVVGTVRTPEPSVILLLGMGLSVLLISAATRKVSHA